MAAHLIRISVAVPVLVALAGCRRAGPPRINVAAVERCERGIGTAVNAETSSEGSHIYYETCKDIHAEPGCREAFASASKVEPEQALAVVSEGCRKAYCPILESASLEMCKTTFQLTLASALRSWPPMHEAII